MKVCCGQTRFILIKSFHQDVKRSLPLVTVQFAILVIKKDVGPDLGPNCLQRSSADNTSSQRVNPIPYVYYDRDL